MFEYTFVCKCKSGPIYSLSAPSIEAACHLYKLGEATDADEYLAEVYRDGELLPKEQWQQFCPDKVDDESVDITERVMMACHSPDIKMVAIISCDKNPRVLDATQLYAQLVAAVRFILDRQLSVLAVDMPFFVRANNLISLLGNEAFVDVCTKHGVVNLAVELCPLLENSTGMILV